ncbi:MAG: redoxin domain-containing protein [Sphingobacteriales bacterium]|nr:redoxin domain-containing protein [Sphingobacteriales bacterium]
MRLWVLIILFMGFSFDLLSQTPAAKVPAFTFFRANNKPFTEKDLAVNKILFFVFFDVTCDHCQHAITEINTHFNELKKTSLYLLTLDNSDKVGNFLNQYGPILKNNPSVIVLQDKNNEFIKKFGPRKYPSLFLYSPKREFMMYDDDEKMLPLFLKKIKEYKD